MYSVRFNQSSNLIVAELCSCTGAQGLSEIDAFLAELRDNVQDTSADAPAPSTGASSSLAEFEAQQVQQLVERAMLSDDLSVSTAKTGDLDDSLRQQWHNQWHTSDAERCSSQAYAATDPSSQSLDAGSGSVNAQAGKDCASNDIERAGVPFSDSDCTSEGVCIC